MNYNNMLILIYMCLVHSAIILQTCGIVQDFYWRDYVPGDIPCDAYQCAPGKYIGQINVNSNNLPATIYTHSNVAVGELEGKKTTKEDIKILCSPDNTRFYWDYLDLNKVEDLEFQDAVKGGFETEEHVQLYIGKATHEKDWKIGKVHIPESKTFEGLSKGLWVWDEEEKGVNFHQFFLLKYNRTDCCHKHSVI